MKLVRVRPEPFGARALTFIVTADEQVLWWPVLSRHRSLRQIFALTFEDVVWGGVLDASGAWERPSIDHGDAPSLEERQRVVGLLQEAWKAEEAP